MDRGGRRTFRALLGAALGAATVLAGVILVHAHRDRFDMGNMAIAAGQGDAAAVPWRGRSTPTEAGTPDPGQPPFITSVSVDARYFLDQYGRPLLVQGDSPWSLMTDLAPQQVTTYWENRSRHGVNAAIVSLLGATGNGGPYDDGRTFDGISPFRDGRILDWNPVYWDRVHSYVASAAAHGITVMLYPVDSWTIGHSFVPADVDECGDFGRKVASRMADLPNVVWMAGGDYVPDAADLAAGSDVDHCVNALMRGVRGTGDNRLFSIQLGHGFTTANPYWRPRVDWSFVYTYEPTYDLVLRAYRQEPHVPVVLGEANYEGENNQPGTPATTDATLRRQVLWSLTSGAAGDFFGSDDWEFLPGWETRLDSSGIASVAAAREAIERLPWWDLVPDRGRLLVGGRGGVTSAVGSGGEVDVLDSDRATAAATPDGSAAVVYVPTHRRIQIDTSALAPGVTAAWVDPSTGSRSAVGVRRTYTPPGANADGGGDWLLVFTGSRAH